MLTIANTVHKQSLSCWLFLKCELLDETGKKPRLLEPIGTPFSILKDISALSIGKHSIDCLSFLSIIKIYPFSKNIYIYIFLWFIIFRWDIPFREVLMFSWRMKIYQNCKYRYRRLCRKKSKVFGGKYY